MQTTPAVAAVVAVPTLYLWPILLVQIAWYATVPHGLSTGGGIVALALRGATYLFIAGVVAAATGPFPGLRIGASIHSTIRSARIDDAIAAADGSLYRAKHRTHSEGTPRAA